MRMMKKILWLSMMGAALAAWQMAVAQAPSPAPAAASAQAPAAAAQASTPAAPDSAVPQTVSTPATAEAAPAKSPAAAPALAVKKGKKEKEVYTGPTEIIVQAPTPMLDEEGKQRLDPDGKPMFNAPVKQQRDKKGHPLFDEKNKPVFQTATELGYDENGKKIHAEKVKPPKLTPVAVVGGTYTVDGVIGKAALNYDIADLKYIYLWAPGIGITVVSNAPFPGAKEQPNAFNDKTLTVLVGDHMLQLASEKKLLTANKDKKPESAFVLVDREFSLPSKYPVVGYGETRKAPYQWPGAKANALRAGAVVPPPPPQNLLPTQLMKPCPTGMMRKPGPPVLPGQVAVEQPCVPLIRGTLTKEQIKAAQAAKPATAVVVPSTTAQPAAAKAPEPTAPVPATTPSPTTK